MNGSVVNRHSDLIQCGGGGSSNNGGGGDDDAVVAQS